MTQTYHIPSRPTVTHHWHDAPAYVSDVASDDDDMSNLLIEARLRSGDYFVTLATELDKLASLLADQDIPESGELERFIAELTYLDKHYRLEPK